MHARFSFPLGLHAEIRHSSRFRSPWFKATRGAAICTNGLTTIKTRPRCSTTCSCAHAESALKLSLQIIDSVRRRDAHPFVAIDEAAFECSIIPLIGYASRGFRLFCLDTGLLDSNLSHCSDSLQWRLRHRRARTQRRRYKVSRLVLQLGFSCRGSLHHGRGYEAQISY
jgi:hypothetical protein